MSEKLIPRDGEAAMALVPPVEGWSNPYIGLPWQDGGLTRSGVACWGLVCLVYAEIAGLQVPNYAEGLVCCQERREIADIFAQRTRLPPWIAVDPKTARALDILVFRVGGLDAHVGLYASPGRMLHITEGGVSGLADFTSGRWAPRLSAVYRHHALMGSPIVG